MGPLLAAAHRARLLLLLQVGTAVISTCTSCKKAFMMDSECLDRCPGGLSQYGLHSNFGWRWCVLCLQVAS